jgi:ribonuclease G
MSKELVISTSRHETRVAVLEEDQVTEVYYQRENEYSLAGSIHKGRVTRVLPGMQSAFVDIGLDRDAFLYVSDFFEDNEEYDKIVTSVEDKVFKQHVERNPASVTAAPVLTTGSAEPTAEPVEPVEAEAVAAEPSAAAPAPPPHAGAGMERRDDRRNDDRRGGRRSRRRRGQKGGGGDRRGLPDSKFYSPRAEAAEYPVHPAGGVEEEPARAADDMVVLPGESLAKYSEPEENAGVTSDGGGAEPDAAAEEEREAELAGESAMELAADPQPELAAAVEEAMEEADAPFPVPEPESEASPAAVAEPETPAEIAEDVDVVSSDAAEPSEASEAGAAEAEPAEGAESAPEPPEAGEGAEGEAPAAEEGEGAESSGESTEEASAEPEGPEPARIPTSLTATLREQGQNPRFMQQHRMSRRTRRNRGRDRGPGGEGQPRPPQHEARTQERGGEARTAAAPQQHTAEGRSDRPATPSISDLLKEGQEIIVQIAKEPLGQKGARITSHIALPGRFLVYMPTVDHIGVSRKIPSDDERLRLKRILQSNRTGIPGGFIVRTAGDGRTEEELRADMMFLYNMWLDMRQKAERRPAPLLVHHDLNVVERILRDQLTSSFKSIWVDSEDVYESVLQFVQRFQPALVNRVKMYTRSAPIFDEFGITAELEKALRPKVWLKSGGYIVINQTEALVAIDINTGKYVGKSNRLEDTIVKTNTDAIKEIVRQIRLRDLGGIIVVDFIDMDERKNRQKVMQALEEAMRADRAPYKILQFNDFGLVAITRKRVKQSLERTLCTPCPYCEGAGYVKSPQTVVDEIIEEAHKIAKAVEGKDVMLRVNPEVAKLLKSNQNSYLQELEEILGRTVFVKSDSQLHQEKFDLA